MPLLKIRQQIQGGRGRPGSVLRGSGRTAQSAVAVPAAAAQNRHHPVAAHAEGTAHWQLPVRLAAVDDTAPVPAGVQTDEQERGRPEEVRPAAAATAAPVGRLAAAPHPDAAA